MLFRSFEWRLKQRKVPTGDIHLKPAWAHDYVEMANAHTRTEPLKRKSDVCLVELGRYGDIINILPVARLIAERWGKPAFLINREFASILDGVSYVTPHIYENNYGEINKAIELAKKTYPCVINAQIWGAGFNPVRQCPAYNLESWRMAGFESAFHNPALLPVFDRRNLAQEEAIFKKLSDGRPMLLLKAHGALSAPYASGAKLEELMRQRFEPDYQVVELGSLKTERIYDLIGVMDRAALLVTIDTMSLHLAAASDVPVVALVNHDPWVSSIPRCNCVAKINYSEANPNPEKVIPLVEQALQSAARRPLPSVPAINPTVRKLFHAVERHEERRDPRKEEAWQSWDLLYDQGVVPCHYWKYERDARGIGDKRALPYLKDVLKFAMNQAGDDDIIFWTNDDVVLHPDLPAVLKIHVAVYGACSSQRCEFRARRMPDLKGMPSVFAEQGGKHMGRDLLAFTKAWLVKRWDELPDFILGASDFDNAISSLIRLEKGIVTTRRNLEESIFPAELHRGLVSHIAHPSVWSQPHVANSAPSQLLNRRLFKEWASQNLPALIFNKQNTI